MKATIYIRRDQYGRVVWADIHSNRRPAALDCLPCKHRVVGTTKQLAYAMLQSGTRKTLFDTAWRMAIQSESVSPSQPFRYGDDFDVQTIEYAKQEAEQVDYFIGMLVNNPRSIFHIHG